MKLSFAILLFTLMANVASSQVPPLPTNPHRSPNFGASIELHADYTNPNGVTAHLLCEKGIYDLDPIFYASLDYGPPSPFPNYLLNLVPTPVYEGPFPYLDMRFRGYIHFPNSPALLGSSVDLSMHIVTLGNPVWGDVSAGQIHTDSDTVTLNF